MKKIIKKTKKIMKKCPNCGVNLKQGGLRYIETGEMIYTIDYDSENKDLNWDQDEFSNSGDGIFCCANCGEELPLTEKEVIKILK